MSGGNIQVKANGLNADHLAVLAALVYGFKLGLATRHQDKVRRKLRDRGLIAYCGKPVRWQITADGLAVHAYMTDTTHD